MVKHTQTIRRQLLTNFLSVFDHFPFFEEIFTNSKRQTVVAANIKNQRANQNWFYYPLRKIL